MIFYMNTKIRKKETIEKSKDYKYNIYKTVIQ